MPRGKNWKREKAERFGSRKGPSIPPNRKYEPVRSDRRPPFFREIEAASALDQNSSEFREFVREIVKLPENLAPAVREAIAQQKWKIAPNPLAVIRTAAHQEARRLGLELSL